MMFEPRNLYNLNHVSVFFLQHLSGAFRINFANFKLANVLDVRYPLDYVDYVFGLKTKLLIRACVRFVDSRCIEKRWRD